MMNRNFRRTSQLPRETQKGIRVLMDQVRTLPEREQINLRSWLLSMMKPQYANSISSLPKRSRTLVTACAWVLYSALFSQAPSSPAIGGEVAANE